jgi:hypothetical protein
VPATHEVLLIAATASVIAAVAWSAFGIARFSGQSGVPSWYRNSLAALFCTVLLLVAAAVVVAVYIEDRHIESSKVNGAAISTSNRPDIDSSGPSWWRWWHRTSLSNYAIGLSTTR